MRLFSFVQVADLASRFGMPDQANKKVPGKKNRHFLWKTNIKFYETNIFFVCLGRPTRGFCCFKNLDWLPIIYIVTIQEKLAWKLLSG